MPFNDDENKYIRECNIEINCYEVKIYQPKLDDGYILDGYGTIRLNEYGALYIDFVCLKSNKRVSAWEGSIPQDYISEDQILVMEAKELSGREIYAEDIQINPTMQDSMTHSLIKYRLGLREISISEELNLDQDIKNSLYFEFNEKCSIPKNKINEYESTHGYSSSSWDQTVLNYENIEINIITHDEYMSVSALGNDLELDKLREAVIFYLNLTSGRYVQPYYEKHIENSKLVTKLKSIDKDLIHRNIPPPISGYEFGPNKDNPHIELFNNICSVYFNNESIYESVYSQWKRVWFALLSPENSVPKLTLSVAVEGLLNDIFIPKISKKIRDMEFEEEKKSIILQLKSLDEISEDHMNTITSFVEKWGNVHAKKAIDYLVGEKVLEKSQQEAWSKLRNSSTHPKLIKIDEARIRKDQHRTVICLGLFYRLTLNVFSYNGAQFTFDKPKANKLALYKYVNILNLIKRVGDKSK